MYKIILFLFLFTSIYADVKLYTVDNFVENEAYDFTIEANGDNIKFPKIDKVDGNIVQNLGTSTSLTIINGKKNKSVKRSFRIFPTKNFILPSFDINIDGKTFSTKSLKVQKIKQKQTISKDYYLELKTQKDQLYVGESSIVTIVFGYKKDLNIVDLSLNKPRFENFWVKNLDNNKKYEKDGFAYQEINFLVTPQIEGNLTISPVQVIVTTLQDDKSNHLFFSSPTVNKKIVSNEINFSIKALPQSLSLIGKFNIEASVDKNQLSTNEALSLKVHVYGNGNINDIKKFELDIPNATIYTNEPKIEFLGNEEENKFDFVQTFSIVSNSDYTIKPLVIEYFDKDENIKKTIQTKEFNIDIINEEKIINDKKIEVNKEKIVVEKDSFSNDTQKYTKYFFLVIGIILGLLISLFFNRKNKDAKNEININIEKKINSAKTKVELLKILAPYIKNDLELDKILFELDSDKEIDLKLKKKEIIQIIKSLKIKGI